jgi:P27 family predicted phage terminase small subunit
MGTKDNSPAYLRPETRQWWNQVVDGFELEPHHVRLLTLAASAWDRAEEARERVKKDGAYLKDRFGQLRAHPAVAVERDCMVAFARLLRELALDAGEPDRPPRIGGKE